MSSTTDLEETAQGQLLLLAAAIGGLLLVVATPMAVVPVVGCLGVPLWILAFGIFSLAFVCLGRLEVGWLRVAIGTTLVVLALGWFYAAFTDGVWTIVLHWRRGVPLALFGPMVRVACGAFVMAIGVAFRHRKLAPIAPGAATIYALTALLGWGLLAILCALGLPTTA